MQTALSATATKPREDAIADYVSEWRASGALQQQAIRLVSIEPIRARLSDRWEKSCWQVWVHTDHILREAVGSGSLIARLDETRFLIAPRQGSSEIAEEDCIRAAYNLMKLYLGRGDENVVQLYEVVEFVGDSPVCRRIDSRRVMRFISSVSDSSEAPPAPIIFQVATRSNRLFEATVSLSPILRVDTQAQLGWYAARKVRDCTRDVDLNDDDLAAYSGAELADLERDLLRNILAVKKTSDHLSGAIVVPISYKVLTSPFTGDCLLDITRQFSDASRSSCIWEIRGIDEQCSTDRINGHLARYRKACRGMLGNCKLDVQSAKHIACLKLGMTVDIDNAATKLEILKTEQRVREVRSVVPSLTCNNISRDQAGLLSLVGATHCTLRTQLRG